MNNGAVPACRVRRCNDRPLNANGEFVLYWMIANRRPHWNFALDRAIEHAVGLSKPIIVLEPLRVDYPWASDRLHRFVMDGMLEHARHFRGTKVRYYPYVEPSPGAGAGLLSALADRACIVITDEFPAFFLPKMVASASKHVNCGMEQVDSNGLLPIHKTDRAFGTAHAFRRFLQQELPRCLAVFPRAMPLAHADLPIHGGLPADIVERWPLADPEWLDQSRHAERTLPIDHGVSAVEDQGGFEQAERHALNFLSRRLHSYAEERHHPDSDASSKLSPWLHFGHISTHFIFSELAADAGWDSAQLSNKPTGARSGWWHMDENREAFLDQIVTWRELGFNMCAQRDDFDSYQSLPAWALRTLGEHARDKRPYIASYEQLERGQSPDGLWNAAQTQLRKEGRIHNYLRMLWGKKILEWSESPEEALKAMIELNNKYAVDGRDPNSYSGIFWVLGRYDRPWGPERPIFGKIRYMTSGSARRKLQLEDYLSRYGSD